MKIYSVLAFIALFITALPALAADLGARPLATIQTVPTSPMLARPRMAPNAGNIASFIGRDENSNKLLAELKSRGVAITQVTVPKAKSFVIIDLNNNGQLLGSYVPMGKTKPRLFLWDAGRITDLGEGQQASFNDQGEVVFIERYQIKSSPRSRAYLISENDKKPKLIKSLPKTLFMNIAGINNNGQIAGTAEVSCRPSPNINDGEIADIDGGCDHVFVNEGGVTTDLGPGRASAINEQGHIAGSKEWRATKWTDGVPVDLGIDGSALRLNDIGTVVGSKTMAQKNKRGQIVSRDFSGYFIFKDGQFQNLPFIGIGWLNNRDELVGHYVAKLKDKSTGLEMLKKFGPYPGHPVFWRNGEMADLNDLLPADSDIELSAGGLINDYGQIVASGYNLKTGKPVTLILSLK